MKRSFSLLLILILTLFLLLSCSNEYSATRFSLGTVCTISVEGKDSKEICEELFSIISEVEHEISLKVDSSAISLLKQNAGVKPVELPSNIYALIKRAYSLSVETDGAFDLAIEPLVSLWAIGTENERVPEREEIESVLPLLDYSLIEFDDERQSVYLPIKGMGIDLGGIGKGYITDLLVEYLKTTRASSAVINLGGNIYVYNKELRVGLQTPFEANGAYYTVLKVKDKAVVTSGAYQRNFESDGVLYHHILDMKTGYPAASSLSSVTIVSEDATLADALSTACFVRSEELESLSRKFKVKIHALSESGSLISY